LNRYRILLPVLTCGLTLPLPAQTGVPQTKVGIINIQGAIIGTKDGQKAANDLQARFDPKKKELDQMQSEIAGLRDQLSKGSNTMSEEAKATLIRQIDDKTKRFNRATEDAQAEFDAEQQKLIQGLGQKIMTVIDKYSRDNGFAIIFDVSSPQTPVLYAANSIDITKDIIELYDKNSASAAAPPPAASTAPSPAPSSGVKPVAPKPAPAK